MHLSRYWDLRHFLIFVVFLILSVQRPAFSLEQRA